jgi:subtilisin-like proprotein convertase family protein
MKSFQIVVRFFVFAILLNLILLPGALAQPAPDPAPDPAFPPSCAGEEIVVTNSTTLAIADESTINPTVNVAGAPVFTFQVELTAAITHTWTDDLDIRLTSPSGTIVTISTDNGTSNDNVFNGTVWSDFAGTPTTDFAYANNVTATALIPEAAMGAFYGEDPNGDWTLTITDDAGGDTGSLSGWSLTIRALNAAPNQFTTIVASSDTPVAIPDSGQVNSIIEPSGLGGFLCGVSLTTNITHTWVSDLDIFLTNPDAVTQTLTTDNGSTHDNVLNGTAWEDTAPVPVTDFGFVNNIVAPLLAPEGALSGLIGGDPNGTWTLNVRDDAGGDTGSLNAWQLALTTCDCLESQPRAQITVSKDFADGNPAEVEVNLSCNTGLILDQSKLITEGDPVHFVVTDYDDGELNCTVTETPVDGYDSTYFNGTDSNTLSCEFEDLPWSASRSCSITNTPEPVDVVVYKDWVIEGSGSDLFDPYYELTIGCDGEIVDGDDAGDGTYYYSFQNSDGIQDTSYEVEVVPYWDGGTHCWVNESGFDDAVEVSSDCGSSGNGGLLAQLGEGDSCSVTNTVFYEGIPTLSTYGLAVLALLMLGLGFAGFRRFN